QPGTVGVVGEVGTVGVVGTGPGTGPVTGPRTARTNAGSTVRPHAWSKPCATAAVVLNPGSGVPECMTARTSPAAIVPSNRPHSAAGPRRPDLNTSAALRTCGACAGRDRWATNRAVGVRSTTSTNATARPRGDRRSRAAAAAAPPRAGRAPRPGAANDGDAPRGAGEGGRPGAGDDAPPPRRDPGRRGHEKQAPSHQREPDPRCDPPPVCPPTASRIERD